MSQPSEEFDKPQEVNEAELYLEAIGGLKKQRFYGLGYQASSFYSYCSVGSTFTSS